MSTDKNVQTVKDFFAAIGRGDKEGLVGLVAEDIEWIIPDEAGGREAPRARRGGGCISEGFRGGAVFLSRAPRICSARRSGSGHRLCQGEDHSHEQDVRGTF